MASGGELPSCERCVKHEMGRMPLIGASSCLASRTAPRFLLARICVVSTSVNLISRAVTLWVRALITQTLMEPLYEGKSSLLPHSHGFACWRRRIICGAVTQADASGANFDEAQLVGGDFVGARLVDASFRNSILKGARFGSADLTGATLEGAVTEGADFAGVVVDRAWLPEATWHHVAVALHGWASHGKRLRVELTGLPAEHRAVAQRAFASAGMKDVRIATEGERVFVCGLSTVK